LEAKLNYWPFSQALADELLGPGTLPVEIVTIASDDTKVAIAPASPKVAPASPKVAIAPASPKLAIVPASPKVAIAPTSPKRGAKQAGSTDTLGDRFIDFITNITNAVGAKQAGPVSRGQ